MPAVKKSSNPYARVDLPWARLYLDDIEAIVKVLESSSSNGVTLESRHYELATVEDMLTISEDESVDELVLTTRNPFNQVSLTYSNASALSRAVTQPQADFTVASILKIVRKRRLLAPTLAVPLALIAAFVFVGNFVADFAISGYASRLSWIVATMNLPIWLLSAYGFFQRVRGQVQVVPRRKAQADNLWKRNRDRVFLPLGIAIFSALFGAVGGGLIVFYLTRR